MKRKSILMTIVAVLFAGIAWGQIEIPLPTGPSLPGDVVDADTIYFCVSSDSLYPIEFGYDVSGRQLHPSYGEWHLKAKTSDTVRVADYKYGSEKNGGAGNAYKAVGSGLGGLLFEYTAKDKQCGLDIGKKFWVYVFVLPQENKVVNPVDTFICYKETTDKFKVEFATLFGAYTHLYAQAGFDAKWVGGNSNAGLTENIRLDSIATYSLRDTLVVNVKSPYRGATYTCGDSIPFLYEITVDSIVRDTIGKSIAICVTDTLDDPPLTLKYVFQRTALPGGAYYDSETGGKQVTDILKWTTAERTAKKKVFYYRYTPCKATVGTVKVIGDTLKLLEPTVLTKDSIGIDTVSFCRRTGTIPILHNDLWGKAWYQYKPLFNPDGSDSYWTDKGVSYIADPNGTVNYGTTTNPPKSSLNGHDLNLDIMKSSVGYYYLWNIDNTVQDCYVSGTKPAYGVLAVVLRDPVVAQDYTAQLCQNSYAIGQKFNFKNYTGLAVAWKDALDVPVANGEIEPQSMLKSTYKYKYDVPADCGAGGKGVFYIKITSNVKAPVKKEVKYCTDKLPGTINISDVLGIDVLGLTWKVESSKNPSLSKTLVIGEEFINGNTLVVGKYFSRATADIVDTLVFTIDAGTPNCGLSASTEVTITFTGTL